MKNQKLKVGDKISYTEAFVFGKKAKRITATITEIVDGKIILDNGAKFIIVTP